MNLQAGFDLGFAAGSQLGKQLGILRGQASGILAYLLKVKSDNDDDERVDRVRALIGDLNRCDPLPQRLEQAKRDGEISSPVDGNDLHDGKPASKTFEPTQTSGITDEQISRFKLQLDDLLDSISVPHISRSTSGPVT